MNEKNFSKDSFRNLFNMLEIHVNGAYLVNSDGKIVLVNKSCVELLGFKRKKDIIGRYLHEFCLDRKKLDEFNKKIKLKKALKFILPIKNANNNTLEVEFSSQLCNDFSSAHWGTLSDVTVRQRRFRTLDCIPTGFFYIEKGYLKDCNDLFAKIHGYKNKEEAIGIYTKKLFVTENEWDRYLNALSKADSEKKALQNYRFNVKAVDTGNRIHVSVDSHMVKDGKGNIVGREGTVRDITSQVEMENSLEKTSEDLHRILHIYLHPIFNIVGKAKTINSIIENLISTITHVNFPDSLGKKLGKCLKTKLEKIINKVSDNHEIDLNLKQSLLDIFKPMLNNLHYYTVQKDIEDVIIDSIIIENILQIIDKLKESNFILNNCLQSIIKGNLIAYFQGILISFLKQRIELLASEAEIMHRQVLSIKYFISLEKEKKLSFDKIDIKTILKENIRLFSPILFEKGIEIEPKITGNLHADISRTDIDRTITNLLRNASYYSKYGKSRFVRVEARELQPKNHVEVIVENLGFPIKQEEIDTGKIFKYGYRGDFSYKAERDGFGAGLADSKQVIEDHNGEIRVSSTPIRFDGDPPEYKVPYLTKVVLRIPKSQKKKE